MKLKSLILSFALTMFAVSGLLAQEKYEHGTLLTNSILLVFTVNGKSDTYYFEKKDNGTQLTMKKLDELSQDGWEVFNVTEMWTGNSSSTRYHLRKKKN